MSRSYVSTKKVVRAKSADTEHRAERSDTVSASIRALASFCNDTQVLAIMQ